jgi:hypothetical protein
MSVAQTTPYTPGVTQEGVVYFLPKTAIRITLQIEKTTYTPGDFAGYAQRYMRLNNVSGKPSVTYRVTTIRQSAFGMADTTKCYAVKFDPKSVVANVALADDGVLLALNGAPSTVVQPKPFVPAPKKAAVNPRRFLNEDILAAGSTAKMAELTAQEIYDIRESKSLLIKGQADFMPKDGEQLRLMLAQLTAQDEVLTSMFAGTTVRDTLEQDFIVCPERQLDRQPLFRFSRWLGLVDSDDLSGVPYFISIDNLNTVPPADRDAAAKSKKKKSDDGLYVNVPSKMRVTIYCGNDQLSQAEYPAPQFGQVELLSADLFNKRFTTHLWLNPISGAVERLDAEQPK